MSNDPHIAAPLAVHRDCPRCGKPVQPVDLVTECPHCGYEIRNPRPVPLAETIVGGNPVDSHVEVRPESSVATEKEPDPLIGTDLDVYRIDALLGRGGMGRVYLAHHRDLDRPCALKILLPELAQEDADYVDRFINEGQAAAKVVHPNIITIHGIGHDRGFHFLEMEFVPGRSLRQLVEDELRLSPELATALAARIADGLAEAHRAGIIHRDLKPDNVLLTLQGIPKLADFGLAKRVNRHGEGDLPEGLCGTPQFMAPELYQGTDAGPETDVYALGVSYYKMLTGRVPFHGESLHAMATAHLNEPVPNIRKIVPEVTLEMAECLNLMLDKNPANRPANGIQAAQLLQAILGQARDLDSLLGQAFRDDPRVSWSREGPQRFRLNVQLPGSRHQAVYIEPSAHGAAERLLLIYSTCCPAQQAYYEAALRLNSEMPHGSVAIREMGGQLKFVVLDTYPRSTVGAEEIRRSTHEVASRADAIEKLLTGADRE
ncbi:MAG TPA: protein kinase [Planctomycetaceae bacterium]|jgi:serine/threonine-protein kinase